MHISSLTCAVQFGSLDSRGAPAREAADEGLERLAQRAARVARAASAGQRRCTAVRVQALLVAQLQVQSHSYSPVYPTQTHLPSHVIHVSTACKPSVDPMFMETYVSK